MSTAMSTPLTDALGCRHPVVQTAMGWVADARLVAATCNAGGFGFLAGATLHPDEVELEIRKTLSLTAQPFGINFHMFQPNAAQIVESAIRHRLRAVSYGRSPDRTMVQRLRRAGILCMPTVGAVKHARKAVEMGADIVTVQGSEGGGHTGSVASTVLLPQVLDAVRVPVVAAGGFYDGRGLAAALAYGAAGVAMGTRFLLTRDSPVPQATLKRYLAERDPAAFRVTTALDGLPQRLLDTPLLHRFEGAGALRRMWIALRSAWHWRRHASASLAGMLGAAWRLHRGQRLGWAQTLMAANAPVAIQRAMADGRPDEGVLPGGQVAGLIAELKSCAELIEDMVRVAETQLRRALTQHEAMPA
jgi:nitronate monooxygenase